MILSLLLLMIRRRQGQRILGIENFIFQRDVLAHGAEGDLDMILFRLAEEMLDDRVKDSLTHAFAEDSADAQKRAKEYE